MLFRSLYAVHGALPLAHVAVVYLGGSAIAAAAPTPGGLGAMEAALVAGLTGFGLSTGPAIARGAGVSSVDLLVTDPAWVRGIPAAATIRRDLNNVVELRTTFSST